MSKPPTMISGTHKMKLVTPMLSATAMRFTRLLCFSSVGSVVTGFGALTTLYLLIPVLQNDFEFADGRQLLSPLAASFHGWLFAGALSSAIVYWRTPHASRLILSTAGLWPTFLCVLIALLQCASFAMSSEVEVAVGLPVLDIGRLLIPGTALLLNSRGQLPSPLTTAVIAAGTIAEIILRQLIACNPLPSLSLAAYALLLAWVGLQAACAVLMQRLLKPRPVGDTAGVLALIAMASSTSAVAMLAWSTMFGTGPWAIFAGLGNWRSWILIGLRALQFFAFALTCWHNDATLAMLAPATAFALLALNTWLDHPGTMTSTWTWTGATFSCVATLTPLLYERTLNRGLLQSAVCDSTTGSAAAATIRRASTPATTSRMPENSAKVTAVIMLASLLLLWRSDLLIANPPSTFAHAGLVDRGIRTDPAALEAAVATHLADTSSAAAAAAAASGRHRPLAKYAVVVVGLVRSMEELLPRQLRLFRAGNFSADVTSPHVDVYAFLGPTGNNWTDKRSPDLPSQYYQLHQLNYDGYDARAVRWLTSLPGFRAMEWDTTALSRGQDIPGSWRGFMPSFPYPQSREASNPKTSIASQMWKLRKAWALLERTVAASGTPGHRYEVIVRTRPDLFIHPDSFDAYPDGMDLSSFAVKETQAALSQAPGNAPVSKGGGVVEAPGTGSAFETLGGTLFVPGCPIMFHRKISFPPATPLSDMAATPSVAEAVVSSGLQANAATAAPPAITRVLRAWTDITESTRTLFDHSPSLLDGLWVQWRAAPLRFRTPSFAAVGASDQASSPPAPRSHGGGAASSSLLLNVVHPLFLPDVRMHAGE